MIESDSKSSLGSQMKKKKSCSVWKRFQKFFVFSNEKKSCKAATVSCGFNAQSICCFLDLD